MSFVDRAKRGYSRYHAVDILRKGIHVIGTPWRATIHFARRCRFYYFTKCWVYYLLGKVHINSLGHYVKIGEKATIYHNTVLEISETSKLTIGDYFTLSYGAIISCQYSITIGNYVMIGEYASIRDTTHIYKNAEIPFSRQQDEASEIVIGNNVWIGRNCLLLPGTVVENNVIIAAHSVVKGRLESNSLYGGVPARFIKKLYPDT